jgi:hypothetical protein
MSARIKETLYRFWRIDPPPAPGTQAPRGAAPAADLGRLCNSPSYRKLLAEFALPNSAEAVTRSPYWKEVFSEPVRSILRRLREQGVLIEPIDPRARMCRDRDESDLRLLCVEHGLQPTGSAAELVDRLLTIDPTAWLLGYAGELLQCSEWSKRKLASRRDRVASSPVLDPDLAGLFTQGDVDTQRYRLQDRLDREPTDNEVIWELLKGRGEQSALEGNLALCRNVHLGMANHLLRRNKKSQALQALCVVCVFDLCGARNRSDAPAGIRKSYSRFDLGRASLPSGLVRRVSDLSRELRLSMDELREIFLAIGTRLNVPKTPRQLWVALHLALEGAHDGKARVQPTRLAASGSDTHADRFGLKIVLEDLAAHLAAPARLLVAAEGQRRVEDVVAIDPDRAGSQLIGDTVSTLDVAGP